LAARDQADFLAKLPDADGAIVEASWSIATAKTATSRISSPELVWAAS
jgi:hypothetical protein